LETALLHNEDWKSLLDVISRQQESVDAYNAGVERDKDDLRWGILKITALAEINLATFGLASAVEAAGSVVELAGPRSLGWGAGLGGAAALPAAEGGAGGSQALVKMEEATFQAALRYGGVRTVAGYRLYGTAGRVAGTYNVNIFLWEAPEGQTLGIRSLSAFLSALRAEASATGATDISIWGGSIYNPSIANLPVEITARWYGLSVSHINPTSIFLRGPVVWP
jgi:hypothetical protein